MAATVVEKTIGPDKDYASLDAWYNSAIARGADLTATYLGNADGRIERAVCYAFDDTTYLNMQDGGTTSATCYFDITVADGEWHAGKWDDDKYNLVVSGAAINCSELYARFNRLQISSLVSTGYPTIINYLATSGNIRFTNCIIRGQASGTAVIYGFYMSQTGTQVAYLNNCIVQDCTRGTSNSYGIYNNSSGATIYAENCTLYNCYWGLGRDNGTFTAKNCGIIGSGGGATLGTVGQTTCSTTTPHFVSTSGTYDLHLASDDDHWKDQGTDLSADAGWVLGAVDIDGQTRSGTWDIGADEYVAAEAVSVTPSPAIMTGTGDQPTPTLMGDANLSADLLEQLAEAVDPTLDTTRNLGVGNYRSTKVTMDF